MESPFAAASREPASAHHDETLATSQRSTAGGPVSGKAPNHPATPDLTAMLSLVHQQRLGYQPSMVGVVAAHPISNEPALEQLLQPTLVMRHPQQRVTASQAPPKPPAQPLADLLNKPKRAPLFTPGVHKEKGTLATTASRPGLNKGSGHLLSNPSIDSLSRLGFAPLSTSWASTELPDGPPASGPLISPPHQLTDSTSSVAPPRGAGVCPARVPCISTPHAKLPPPARSFNLAQSHQTRELKDSARMSHFMNTPLPPHTRSPKTAKLTAVDVTMVSDRHSPACWPPAQRFGRASSRLAPKMCLDSALPRSQQPCPPPTGPTSPTSPVSSPESSNTYRLTNQLAKAGHDWQTILQVVEAELGTAAGVEPCGLASALHKLGCCTQPGAPLSRDHVSRRALLHHHVYAALKEAARVRMSEFSARHVANAVWGLAKLCDPCAPLLAAACQQLHTRMEDALPQHVSNMLWALGTLGYQPGDSFMCSILDHVMQLRAELLPQHISNILLALAKMQHHPGEHVLLGLTQEAARKLDGFVGQALANVAWACAKLGYCPEGLLDGVWLAVGRRHVRPQLNPQNWSNLAWAYATLGHLPAPTMMDEVCSGMLPLLAQSSPQNLSIIAWCMAKLAGGTGNGSPPGSPAGRTAAQADGSSRQPTDTCHAVGPVDGPKARFMRAVIQHATHTVSCWQSQAISNLVWALASLGWLPPDDFLQAVAARMHATLSHWSSQHLSNTLWALAVLGFSDQGLMEAVADFTVNRLATEAHLLDTYKPQHISNILWAYGKLEHPCPRLITPLLKSLTSRLPEFNSQEISNSMWALARLAHYDCTALDAVGDHLVAASRVDQLLPQHLANIAWAYGRLTHLHHPLMSALAQAAQQHMQVLSTQHISNMVCAFALLALEEPGFMSMCRQQGSDSVPSCRDPHTFNLQQVTNLMWGFALLGVNDLEVWQALMEQLARLGLQAEQLPEEALTQVFQAYQLLLLRYPSQQQLLISCSPPELIQVCERCWRESAARSVVSSMHRDVSATLTAMGIRHVNEQLTEDGLFSVDIALTQLPAELLGAGEAAGKRKEQREVRLALEVDGPSHFAANTLAQPLGATVARRRCLEARGWTIVSISHTAWNGVRGARDKAALLESLLHGVQAT